VHLTQQPAATGLIQGVAFVYGQLPLVAEHPGPCLIAVVLTLLASLSCCPPSQIQMKAAPVCIKNSTWLSAINGTLSNMLYPRNGEAGELLCM
jgi:hypothetical protein